MKLDNKEDTPMIWIQQEYNKAKDSGSIVKFFNSLESILQYHIIHEKEEFVRCYRNGFQDGQHHKSMLRSSLTRDEITKLAVDFCEETYL